VGKGVGVYLARVQFPWPAIGGTMIIRVKGGYVVKSKDGKKTLSKVYKTRDEAQRRLAQIESFAKQKRRRK